MRVKLTVDRVERHWCWYQAAYFAHQTYFLYFAL